MLIHHCSLKLDTGEVVAEDLGLELRFRERSTKQPDMASLWYGTLIPADRLDVHRFDAFALVIPNSSGGVIQIQHVSEQSDNAIQTIRFDGIGDRPQMSHGPTLESAIRECDECSSNFFPPASIMDGLCPECAHHLYGYEKCEHSIVGVSCEKCGWDGSVSEHVRSLK